MRQYNLEKILEAGNKSITQIKPPSLTFIGRKEELSLIIECLHKRRSKSCILVGEPGVGKTELVRKVSTLSKRIFLSFDCGSVVSGCMLQGMLEDKINKIIQALLKYDERREVTLFIDEIHALFGLGRSIYNGGVSAADMIKPYLSDGELSIIGATTFDEYKKIVLEDKALLRRMPPIFIKPLDEEFAFKAVQAFAGDVLSDIQIRKIMKLSEKLSYLHEPDRSIEVADRLIARMSIRKRVATDDDINSIIDSMFFME